MGCNVGCLFQTEKASENPAKLFSSYVVLHCKAEIGWMAFGAMCIQHLQLLLRGPLTTPLDRHRDAMPMQQH